MAYRFTDTDKWNDSWFSELKPIEKLLFIYLCDNCDIGGFIELNIKRWVTDIDSDRRTIEGALKGLERGLIISESGDCVLLRNFLRHQKNLPLNTKNMAHVGIVSRFEKYRDKFGYENKEVFIEEYMQSFKGASKGAQCPYGNGIGNGIGKEGGGMGEESDVKTWRTDFETYKQELWTWFDGITRDKAWISEQERFNPNLDILLSIEKSIKNFWGTEAGWKNKKSRKSVDLDWKQTFAKTLDINKVYKQRDQDSKELTAPLKMLS